MEESRLFFACLNVGRPDFVGENCNHSFLSVLLAFDGTLISNLVALFTSFEIFVVPVDFSTAFNHSRTGFVILEENHL